MADTETPPKAKLRLGGMALRNGLLVHGPTHWAAAVRTDAGQIKAASGKKPRLAGVDDVPGLRGLVRLGEAMVVIPLVKRGLPEAKLPFQDASVLGVAAGASVAGAALRKHSGGGFAGEAAAGVIGVLPALFALRGGELAAYHGVEHKAIAAYEQDVSPPVDGAQGGAAGGRSLADAAAQPKEHERCGSHLVAPMMASNVAGTLLLRQVLAKPGPMAGAGVALASTAAAVEVFGWCERHSESALSRVIRRPGFAIQRTIGTREPDERQLEVGRAALEEILRVEGAAADH